MTERFGIEPCQWQNLSDENFIQWHCHTHGSGMWEDPRGGPCECAQDQTRAGLAGREEVLPILQDLIAELRKHALNCIGPPDGYDSLWYAEREARDMIDRAEARLREVTGDE